MHLLHGHSKKRHSKRAVLVLVLVLVLVVRAPPCCTIYKMSTPLHVPSPVLPLVPLPKTKTKQPRKERRKEAKSASLVYLAVSSLLLLLVAWQRQPICCSTRKLWTG